MLSLLTAAASTLNIRLRLKALFIHRFFWIKTHSHTDAVTILLGVKVDPDFEIAGRFLRALSGYAVTVECLEHGEDLELALQLVLWYLEQRRVIADQIADNGRLHAGPVRV